MIDKRISVPQLSQVIYLEKEVINEMKVRILDINDKVVVSIDGIVRKETWNHISKV